MLRKVFKTGNSTVVSIPQEYLDALGIAQGEEVSVELDQEQGMLLLRPAGSALADEGVDEEFARRVSEFINKYRAALEELAK
ncbi:MAG: AbrB/MazE/SpoVT family DNA-binding domain-containing protein [Chloroflexi bacterium]|nr:AbrB/MazE/SpoVT family DNA-binding domain-containing protein [Chloroflexota bacterium]